MFCYHCNVRMRYVMRFEDSGMYCLYRCPKCFFETKKLPLIFLDDETNQNN